MRVFRSLQGLPSSMRGSCAVIGCFDGVHLGHRELLNRALCMGAEDQNPILAITFANHPQDVLEGSRLFSFLATLEEKLLLLKRHGADAVLLLTFNRDFSVTSPKDFCRRVLHDMLGVKAVVVGFNFRFGWKKSGTADLLRQQGGKLGFAVGVVPAATIAGKVISSSAIRELIAAGQVGEAATLLGRDYELTGRVIPGLSRGRELGFPTANMSLQHPEKIVPGDGVYAVLVNWRNKWWPAAAYRGKSPTFGNGLLSLEVHMLQYCGNMYGEIIQVRFVERLRSDRKFRNVSELTRQISRDCERAKVILGHGQ